MEKAKVKVNLQGRLHYIESAVFLALMYIINSFVFMNGDDFMYGTFGKTGILRNVLDYYQTGNGRFWINIIDSALLYFDRYLFIILNPLICFAFVWLIAKNIQWIIAKCGNKQNEIKYLRWSMVMFASLDVLCMRETVFWITGMMNYLFPAVVFLLAIYCFQRVDCNGVKGWKKSAYWLLCFLAASSVEQFALMFIGVVTLTIGWNIITKKKVRGCQIVAFVLPLIGLALLLLAPGNFVRVEAQADNVTFIDNFWTLIVQNTLSDVSVPFMFMLSVGISALAFKNAKQMRWYSKLFFAITPTLILITKLSPVFEKAVIYIGVIGLVLIQILWKFFIRRYTYKPMMIMLLIVGLGSQIMLLISAIWGFRCMFSMYMVYMLAIGCLLTEMSSNAALFVLCSGLTLSIHPIITVVYWAVAIIFCFAKRVSHIKNISAVLLYFGVAVSLLTILFGYAENVPVHKENLKNTEFGEKTITLTQLPDELYSWYHIPFGEFHEDYYKQYHELSEDIAIEYIVVKTEK